MTERSHDPFAPRREGVARPRRSTAEVVLPSWLFDTLRDRGVPDEAFDPLIAQFERMTPAERASALAEMQAHRHDRDGLDELASALVAFHEGRDVDAPDGSGDAQEAATPGDDANTSEPVTATSDDQGRAGDDPADDLVPTITAEDVPRNANEAVAWIGDAEDEAALRARAALVLDVELGYPGQMRKTVRQALDLALGAESVQSAIDGRG